MGSPVTILPTLNFFSPPSPFWQLFRSRLVHREETQEASPVGALSLSLLITVFQMPPPRISSRLNLPAIFYVVCLFRSL